MVVWLWLGLGVLVQLETEGREHRNGVTESDVVRRAGGVAPKD